MGESGKVRGRDSSVGQDRLELRGAAGRKVCDDGGDVIIGTRAERAETLQPGIDGTDDGTVGSLQENLEKAGGVETLSTRGSSDGNDGILALGGNAAVGNRMVRPLLNITLRMGMANLVSASTPPTIEAMRRERAKNMTEASGL